jgi:hypothetical protein
MQAGEKGRKKKKTNTRSGSGRSLQPRHAADFSWVAREVAGKEG